MVERIGIMRLNVIQISLHETWHIKNNFRLIQFHFFRESGMSSPVTQSFDTSGKDKTKKLFFD